MTIIGYLMSPLVFGVGFFAPLIAQLLTALDINTFAVSHVYVGLGLGLALGLIAQLRGSWIWIKP